MQIVINLRHFHLRRFEDTCVHYKLLLINLQRRNLNSQCVFDMT
jgi:hypothetical protein